MDKHFRARHIGELKQEGRQSLGIVDDVAADLDDFDSIFHHITTIQAIF